MDYRYALAAAIALLLNLTTTDDLAAQDRFDATDPDVLEAVETAIPDSLDWPDRMLMRIDAVLFDTATGHAKGWQYWFFSPSSGRRFAVSTNRSQAGIRTTVFGLTPYSGSPLPIDTDLPYASSARMIERLRTDAGYQRMVLRDRRPTEVFLDRIRIPTRHFPQPFRTAAPVWQATYGRIGDSSTHCVVSPETGQAVCVTYVDTIVSYMQAESRLSEIEFTATNYGVFGHDVAANNGGFIHPRGSTMSYIFGAGVWFGAEQFVSGSGVEQKVLMTYDPNSGTSWMTPGDGYDLEPYPSFPELYHSINHDMVGARQDTSALRWPVRIASPAHTAFFLRPGTYALRNDERRTGRAATSSQYEQFVSRYRDDLTERFSEETGPIGIQMQEIISAPLDGPHTRSVIVQYQIINKSGGRLLNAVAGILTDADLGTAGNDRSSFYASRPELRTAIVTTEPEPSAEYGSLAITMLEGPSANSSGFIANVIRRGFEDFGRVGTFRDWSIQDDPENAGQRYALMTSGRIDDTSVPHDTRTLMASNRFNMENGDTAWLAVAYTVFPERTTINAGDTGFERTIESLLDTYYFDATSAADDETVTAGALTVAPNPATGRARLAFTLPRGGTARLDVVDALGRTVRTMSLGELVAGAHHTTLDLTALSAGSYIVTLQSGATRTATRLIVHNN